MPVSKRAHPLKFHRTGYCADFLAISRPYLYKFIEKGIQPPLRRPFPGMAVVGYYEDIRPVNALACRRRNS